MFTTEQLTVRWEDQRAIKNLMGKYANCVLLNREHDIYGMFWSKRDDVTLMFNDGAYTGAASVKAYYDACHDRNALVAKLMQKRFPDVLGGKSDDKIYGVGPFKVKPMACPVIEVAGDGKTAKGLWYSIGNEAMAQADGTARVQWMLGKVAADFIREEDGWKIWHLVMEHDHTVEVGTAYADVPVRRPDSEDPLARDYGTPTVEQTVYNPLFGWEYIWQDMPRPYVTYDDKSGYGPGGDLGKPYYTRERR